MVTNEEVSETLLHWNELETWMKDNDFITTRYRPISGSYKLSIRSIFHLHNETVNIWSHLLGSLLFIVGLLHFTICTALVSNVTSTSNVLIIVVYHLAVINCFTLSAAFHAVSNHSKLTHQVGNRLDHLGIVLVIYGSTLTATYFQFYCEPVQRNTYWVLSTTLAVASAVFTLHPEFCSSAYRPARLYAYSLLGFSCFIPICHSIATEGYQSLNDRMSLSHFSGLALVQLFGGLIYALRVPERSFPGAFDIYGHSHQLMHVIAVVGALIYRQGLLEALARWNYGLNSCL